MCWITHSWSIIKSKQKFAYFKCLWLTSICSTFLNLKYQKAKLACDRCDIKTVPSLKIQEDQNLSANFNSGMPFNLNLSKIDHAEDCCVNLSNHLAFCGMGRCPAFLLESMLQVFILCGDYHHLQPAEDCHLNLSSHLAFCGTGSSVQLLTWICA